MQVNEKVSELIDSLLADFKQPDSLDRIATHLIPPDDRPCAKWSWMNRLLVRIRNTDDARGFRQWSEIGRSVKGGSKAIHILIPNMRKVKRKNAKGVEEEKKILVGFSRLPVFKVEDTTGKPVDYPNVAPPEPPMLLGVAKYWGIDVQYGPMLAPASGIWDGKSGRIKLASHDVQVFFHELVHAGQQKISGKPVGGNDPKQEVIAEFGAAILMRLYGVQGEGNAYDYIARYAAAMPENDVPRACMSVLSQTQKVVTKILSIDLGVDDSPAVENGN
jgi:hypothetical protein